MIEEDCYIKPDLRSDILSLRKKNPELGHATKYLHPSQNPVDLDLTSLSMSAFSHLLDSKDTVQFYLGLQRYGVDFPEVKTVFHNPLIYGLAEDMCKNHPKYRFPLAVVLTYVERDKLSLDAAKNLGVILTDLDYSIVPPIEGWDLCLAAEPRLTKAIDDDACLTLTSASNEPLMLVKFTGRLTALSLRNYTVGNGQMFVEGNWYSPGNDSSRGFLRNAFDRGQGRLILSQTDWVHIRSLKPTDKISPEMLLKEAKEFAHNIPKRFYDRNLHIFDPVEDGSIRVLTPQEYQEEFFENYSDSSWLGLNVKIKR